MRTVDCTSAVLVILILLMLALLEVLRRKMLRRAEAENRRQEGAR